MRGLTGVLLGGLAFAGSSLHAETAIGDSEAGARLFKKCQACHKVGEGARNGVGPHLNDVIGRAAGGTDGFRYTESMQAKGEEGLIWNPQTLDTFLTDPRGEVPGTRMSISGIKDAQDRADLIAFLAQFSAEIEAPMIEAAGGFEVAPEILAIEGDPAYGEYLSGECIACHSATGADTGIPSITAWPADDFVTALHAYKEGAREHPVMQMVTGRLSPEEIAALAAYFAGL